MRFTLILGLVLLSRIALSQRNEQGLLPPPAYKEEVDNLRPGDPYPKGVVRREIMKPEKKKDQDDSLDGCTLSNNTQEITCPFGNYKKDSSTDNSVLRFNTKSNLPNGTPSAARKNRSKANAQ